jgi:hypothetical protein
MSRFLYESAVRSHIAPSSDTIIICLYRLMHIHYATRALNNLAVLGRDAKRRVIRAKASTNSKRGAWQGLSPIESGRQRCTRTYISWVLVSLNHTSAKKYTDQVRNLLLLQYLLKDTKLAADLPITQRRVFERLAYRG